MAPSSFGGINPVYSGVNTHKRNGCYASNYSSAIKHRMSATLYLGDTVCHHFCSVCNSKWLIICIALVILRIICVVTA